MHRTVHLLSTMALMAAAVSAQSDPPDSRVTQTLLTEVRQLRLDLQTAAATIQRVQIAMYRIQSEAALLERAANRLESVRMRCDELQEQRKGWSEAEPVDGSQREAFKAAAARLAEQEQQCQIEQVDAETQFRTEQAKMNDFQDQLSRLDTTLAAYGGK